MKTYKCHKIVKAAQIIRVDERCGDVWCDDGKLYNVQFGKRTPNFGDYLVEYDDGYRSFSPKKAFEDGYTEIEI